MIYIELKVDFIRILLAVIMQGMTKVGQETQDEMTVIQAKDLESGQSGRTELADEMNIA